MVRLGPPWGLVATLLEGSPLAPVRVHEGQEEVLHLLSRAAADPAAPPVTIRSGMKATSIREKEVRGQEQGSGPAERAKRGYGVGPSAHLVLVENEPRY